MDLKFVSLIDLFKNHVMLIILMKIQELKKIYYLLLKSKLIIKNAKTYEPYYRKNSS